MLCPYCGHQETKVIDKRDSQEITKRRRECIKCENRFNTQETVEKTELRVIKKDGRRETFDSDKLKRGVMKSFEKRNVSTDSIEKMLKEVEEMLRRKGSEVKSEYIGKIVANRIKKLDKIAYIRFASVYKDFTDLDDFKKEIRSLIGPR